MRKLACLLPLLLTSGAASAQSSVTVYGLLDVAVSVTDAGGAALRQKEMTSGVGLGSRIGFRGTEDLGGGLKANFVLENGFNPDTGTIGQGGVLFGRQAWVGLASSSLSVSFGRQYSPMLLTLATTDPGSQGYWGNNQGTGNALYQSPGSAAGSGGHQATGRINNSILLTGTSGALSGRLMLGLGDENPSGSGRLIGASGNYASGPVLLTAAVTRFRQYASTIVAGAEPDWQTEYAVAGTYNFNVAKLFTGYYNYRPSGANLVPAATTATGLALDPRFTENKTFWIGARVPLAGGTVIANAMRTTFEYAALPDGKSTTLGLAYEYPLSKRTLVYGSYGQVMNNATGRVSLLAAIPAVFPSAAGADPKALSAGIRHTF